MLTGKVGNPPGTIYAACSIFFPLFNPSTAPFTCDATFTTSPDPGDSGNVGLLMSFRTTGDNLFNMQWASPGFMNISAADGSVADNFPIVNGQTYALRVVSDPAAPLVSIYINGVLRASGPATFQDPGNYPVATIVGSNDAVLPLTLDSLSITTL